MADSKKKKNTSLGAVPLRPSGLMGKAARAIAGRVGKTNPSTPKKKNSKDTGGKTTAKSPAGVQKSKAQGEKEKAALRKKQQERMKKK